MLSLEAIGRDSEGIEWSNADEPQGPSRAEKG